jgi:hypothetical protein
VSLFTSGSIIAHAAYLVAIPCTNVDLNKLLLTAPLSVVAHVGSRVAQIPESLLDVSRSDVAYVVPSGCFLSFFEIM